jgi:hypothetical protein
MYALFEASTFGRKLKFSQKAKKKQQLAVESNVRQTVAIKSNLIQIAHLCHYKIIRPKYQ